MVHEHGQMNFESAAESKRVISATLTLAQFGNGVMAIVASQLAQFLLILLLKPEVVANASCSSTSKNCTNSNLQFYSGGDVTPFDLSALVLIVCAFAICLMWTENYGTASRPEGAEKHDLAG